MIRTTITILALFTVLQVYSTNGEKLVIHKTETPIVFDGIPNEKAWKDIEPLPLITQSPIFGVSPSEKTEIRLTYDDNYLYVGARLYDKEPSKIMANSYKRDALIGNTDWFGFIIDTYNDKQNALAFFTNPNGLRLDVNVVNDAYGREPININWNAVWDVEVEITGEGWFVEMRVPFSSIPFQEVDGQVTMGLISWRYIARKNEVDIFPEISSEYGEWSSWKPSLAKEMVLKDVRRKKPLYIAPYVLGGYSSEAIEVTDGYEQDDDLEIEGGLDIKYGITNNLNLDLTFNTDFAQVEADDQQVNLTRFSLFFPEKRLFFQERAGIFDFSFGRRDQLFYSRRVGIYDGSPVRIYGGARLVGRMGDLDVGILNMQTESVDTVPSLNHSVLRFKKQVLNENSDVGFLLTNQMDFEGYYVNNIGIDSRLRISNSDILSIKYAQTFESGSDNKILNPEAGRWFISLVNQTRVGFIYATSFSKAGKDFNPSLGFMQREDFYRWGHRIGYGWIPSEKSFIHNHSISYRGSWFRNNEIGEIDSYSGGMEWSFSSKRGTMGSINLNYSYENIIEEFDISDDVIITPGRYSFINAEVMYTSQFNKPFYATYSLDYGKFYDGEKVSFNFTPNWAASSSLELSASYIFNYLSFENVNETLQVARLKGLYMFSTKTSISSFIQYNSTSKAFLTNIRFRYNPKEGNDFFLVYNDDVNTDRNLEIPRLPRVNHRTIIFKYTYTFRP